MKRVHLPVPVRRLRRASKEDFLLPNPLPEGRVHLFAGCSEEQLSTLARHSIIYTAQSNVALREQDEESDDSEPVGLWYILEGHVHIEHYVDGRSVTIGSLGPGNLVGEVELILGCQSSFSIISVGALTYIEIEPPQLVLELADKEFYSRLSHQLAQKLRDRARKAGLQRTRDVTALVKEYLTAKAREQGLEPGSNQIAMRATLALLATQIGVSRQSVRNAFELMTEFSYDNSVIAVQDPALLTELQSRSS